MSELLIQPYEISVWEDKLTQNGFQEVKLATIGSNMMEGPNKAYDPVFTKKANGEKSLTFSLKYKYFDPYNGTDEIINPFVALLTNERKVKLKYDDKWYEFIIKDHTESSEESTWTYTCTDAFVLELSKNGYDIEFSSDLNNNQGTARELAKKTLQYTDWRLGGTDSFRQLIEEPVFTGILRNPNSVSFLNTDTNEEVNFGSNTEVYVFYSYVKNQNGKLIQFIIKDNNELYTIDSKNVITATNYRIKEELTYQNNGFYLDSTLILEIGEVETYYHANRLAYGQLMTYDPFKGKTVERFTIGEDGREVYKYSDYTYTTSTVITNYFTNGDNFNALDDGTLQGWNPYVDVDEHDTIKKLELVTRPEIGTDKKLADVSQLSQIEGFLKATFNDRKIINNGVIYNLIYNSGIADNASVVDSIAAGDQFVFRWRAGTGDLEHLSAYNGVRAIVAKYTQDQPTRYGYYYKHVRPEDIIVEFDGNIQTLNNYIEGGELVNEIDEETQQPTGKKNYVIDSVVQTPSTKYIYKTSTEEYIWDGETGDFIRYDNYAGNKNDLYLPYYYMIGTANKSLSKKDLTNAEDKKKVGIFVYINDKLTQPVSVTRRFTTQTTTFINDDDEEETEVITTNSIYEPLSPVRGTSVSFTSGNIDITFTTDGVTKVTRQGTGYTFEFNPSTETLSFESDNHISSFTLTYTALAPVYIQDIQLTRYIPDADEQPILVGNLPKANSHLNNYYYLKPDEGDDSDNIVTYTTAEELLADIGAEGELIPLYNENSEKNLSISVSQSNCFNILQTIAETFECWIDLVVEHDAAGKILIDDDGRARKFVYLREYAGKDNYAGFKYGVNLQSIERNINSDEIVTKLIVDLSQSDYTNEGYVSIAKAPSNLSGEQYILNFDYYYNQGLLDREIVQNEIDTLASDTKEINLLLEQQEQYRRQLEASLVAVTSKRNTYTELVDSAKTAKTEALATFEDLTGYIYDDYKELHNNTLIVPGEDETEEEALERISQQLTEEETVADTIGSIYLNSAIINNYSGILSNIEREYWDIKHNLEGYQNYKVKIWVDIDNLNERHVFVEFSDYLAGISFHVGNRDFETTVSRKFFDISPVNDNSSIVFTAFPSGYDIENNTYLIDDYKEVTFKITCETTVPGVTDAIDELIDTKKQLIDAFNTKYRRFIQEGTWNSVDYIDSELYYLDALQVSNTSAQPIISYTINVVEISKLEGYEWYSFDAGDKSYVEDTEFFGWANVNGVLTPAREEVVVSQVEWHLDAPDQNVITVQNYKTRFEDFFQRISAAVQTVQYNEATYAKISSLLDANGTINQDVLLASLNKISGQQYNLTSDGSILINGDNILIRNLTGPANLVKISSEGIKFSPDGGNTWTTAISGLGINIGAVYTGELNTEQVIIGSSNNPSFRWDKAGISAYKSTTSEVDGQVYDVYDLQTFVRYDQNGLYGIKDGGSYKPYTLEEVKDKAHFAVTWDGFFIKNSYTGGGKVQITSENDFQVINSDQTEKIKIGALEWTQDGVTTTTPIPGIAPSLYGIRINNNIGETVFKTGDDGNLEITGTIYANAGEIGGMSVDNNRLRMDHIVFEPGTGIYSDWGETSVYPFIISDKDGSATFNNVVVRGSIKTSVFEYEEIQAVGGAFMFRPSTAIKTATEDNGDLILTVEKPLILRDGAWYKLSNYNSDDSVDADELTTYGLTHIYQLSKTKIEDETEIRLIGGAAILQTINIDDIPGGSIIDMGFEPNTYRPIKLIAESSPVALHLYELVNNEYVLTDDVTVVLDKTYYKEWYQEGINNYGIGINSSDNYINLPPRAISLFETTVNHTQDPKVSYKYRGILGTLPALQYNGQNAQVNQLYHDYLEGTQGIYTDNMYLGDKEQYIAFYEDEDGKKQLRIKANEVVYEIVDDEGQPTGEWQNVQEVAQGADGEDAITVSIDSSAGNVFLNKHIQTTLTCTVTKGNGTDITNQVTRFTWTKKNADGTIDSSWSRPLAGRSITLTDTDVNSKAIFICEVEF